ncbi:MAG: hypothetical protein LAO19_10890 [Acidobacteriia bacterium]|nr:hypothetical protein [Terriglobia bacterium]
MKDLHRQIVSCAVALGIALLPLTNARAAQNGQSQAPPAYAGWPAAAPQENSQGASPGPVPASANTSAPAQVPTTDKCIFHVKYVSEGAVYLDAGRNAKLEEGMILHVVHADPDGGITDAVRFQGKESLADLRIFSVADTSSAAEVVTSREDLTLGDVAYLDIQSVHVRETKSDAAESENYPVVMTFSYGDPLDEEVRAAKASVSAPPIQNQIRGRLGFDVGSLSEPGGIGTRQVGLLVQADMSRIGGTHWNLTGYWRGLLNTESTGSPGGTSPATLNDLMNRTYHLGLYYQNPDSVVTMGVGRLFLPYAPSLSTIDGGYFGYKFSQHMTAGVFGGSTPDPTSWSYNPNQRIAGTFVNYEAGDFDHARVSSTAGLAMTTIGWHAARQFVFLENTFSLGRKFSFYNSLQADHGRTALQGATYTTGITQSFSSVRYSPISLLTFELNHNYLRNLPTFDPALISTGLLDQFLFQGLSGGVTVSLPYRISVSTDVGRSKSSTDAATSWNQMYGLTFGEIKNTGLHLDLRYTKFNSSFGQGNYEFVSLSRSITERLHLAVQGGTQHLVSAFSADTNSRFVTGTADWAIGSRYFLEGLYTWNTGTNMSYRQMDMTFGYRFGGFRK